MKLDAFINKDMFTNLAGCIMVVEAFTEAIKLLWHDHGHYCGLWVAFVFSVIVSIIRFIFNDTHTKEDMLLCAINVVTIFLGSVATYQVGIKQVQKLSTII